MNSNIENLPAVSSIPNPSNDDHRRPTEIRDVMDAIRFVFTLTKQLPLPPLVAAFVVALTLGTIPAATTLFCSAVRELAHWCWGVGKPRREGPRNRDQGSKPSDAQGPLAGPAISDAPVTTNPFESLEYMEPL